MVAQPIEEHQLDTQLDQLHAALTAINLTDYATQTPAQARRTAARLRAMESMLRTHTGAAVRAVDRLVPTKVASHVLAGDFGMDTAAAHREIKQARILATAPASEHAAEVGQIPRTHALIIAGALRELPEHTTAEQKHLVETQLIADAQQLSPKDLTVRARRITELYDPVEQVDAHENQLLSRREAAARHKVSLHMWDNRDGTWKGQFVLPEVQALMLKTVIDAITAPRREHLDNGLSRVQRARLEAENDKPYDRKAGEALIALIEHLPTDRLPTTGGTPARIIITIDEAKLRDGVAAASLVTGERISAGELRRLACNHAILPAILGGKSIPIDLGRQQRLFTPAQRDALAVMDGGCIAPGCDRPPAWCEAHHGADTFAHGGNTNLSEGYLLCSTHHHDAHQHHWQLRRTPTGRAEIDRGRGHGWEHNQRYRP